MLSIIKKSKRLDKFVYQSLRDVVKIGGDNVIKNFEDKFKELQIEGNRKKSSSASVMFTKKMNTMMMRRWKKMTLMMKTKKNLRPKMRIKRPILWAHKARPGEDSIPIDQGLFTGTDSTIIEDSLHNVINHDQT